MDKITEITAEILGIPLYGGTREEVFRALEARRKQGHGGYACFVNVHTATTAAKDPGLRESLLAATYAFPDGVPLVWASRLHGSPVAERISGPDFMEAFLARHPGETFGFIGGQPGQAERIGARFGVEILHYCPPFRPFSPSNARKDWETFVSFARAKSVDVPYYVWVCLGAPKQELWMRSIHKEYAHGFFFGVGAAIDFLSDTKKRAPVWVQEIGCEWLYRLFQEPRRLWRRYLITNTKFAFKVALELLSRK